MTELSTDIKSTLYKAIVENRTFAAWCLPEKDTIQYISGCISLKNIADLSFPAFIISPFERSDNKLLVIEEHNRTKGLKAESYFRSSQSDNKSKVDYLNLVSKGIQAIQDGQFKKVVLSRKEKIDLSEKFDAIDLFQKLVDVYPKAFVSIVSSAETGIWIGASPELLLKKEGNTIQSISLAGTLSNMDSGNFEDISSKDRIEQEIVSQFIREKFDSLDIPFSESTPQIVNTGNLNHIKTSFDANKQDMNIEQLLSSLHPTPAICGYPKDVSKAFILKQENYSRELYGGFLGPVYSDEKTELYVNLRCIQIIDKKGYLFAGAGILHDSIAENEWQETEKKMDTLRSLL